MKHFTSVRLNRPGIAGGCYTRRRHSTAVATGIVLDRREAAVTKREAEIEQKAEQLELSQATKSDASLRRRESAVESREAAATAELDRLRAMRKDLDERLGKIKSLTASLER